MKKFVLTALVFLNLGAHALPVPGTGCAPTAEAAVARMIAGVVGDGSAKGFRVDAIKHDPLRGRSWAVVASCNEPAKPRIALVLASDVPGNVFSFSGTPLIYPGDRVTILSRRGDSQMELLGWAEEAGAEKQHIRVRVGLGLDADHAAHSLRCVVVKAGLVEVAQ
jgi:hypothetical protein